LGISKPEDDYVTSGNSYPVTRYHIPEEQKPHPFA